MAIFLGNLLWSRTLAGCSSVPQCGFLLRVAGEARLAETRGWVDHLRAGSPHGHLTTTRNTHKQRRGRRDDMSYQKPGANASRPLIPPSLLTSLTRLWKRSKSTEQPPSSASGKTHGAKAMSQQMSSAVYLETARHTRANGRVTRVKRGSDLNNSRGRTVKIRTRAWSGRCKREREREREETL